MSCFPLSVQPKEEQEEEEDEVLTELVKLQTELASVVSASFIGIDGGGVG